jgi:hypothetical protein
MLCKKGIQARGQIVPCGQCLHCRINAGRNWTSRILMEQVTSMQVGAFLTLTYAPGKVPKTDQEYLTLAKKKFTKWVNNTYQNNGAFRYYAVGEYGEDTFRPHYHMAVFSGTNCKVSGITDAWKQGHTSAYPLNAERAGYLAQYTTKKLTKDTDSRLKDGQEPEFRVSSKRPALGSAFIPVLVRAYSSGPGQKVLRDRGDIGRTWRYGKRVLPIPRYIADHVRSRLGIPTTHEERLQHDGYYRAWSSKEFATWQPEIAISEDLAYGKKKKHAKLNLPTIRV